MSPEARERSFDELARGLASGDVSRRRALRLMGAALVGGALASIPGVAFAAPCGSGQTRCGHQCCESDETCVKGGGKPRCSSPLCGGCPRGQYCCTTSPTIFWGCCDLKQNGCRADAEPPFTFTCTA